VQWLSRKVFAPLVQYFTLVDDCFTRLNLRFLTVSEPFDSGKQALQRLEQVRANPQTHALANIRMYIESALAMSGVPREYMIERIKSTQRRSCISHSVLVSYSLHFPRVPSCSGYSYRERSAC